MSTKLWWLFAIPAFTWLYLTTGEFWFSFFLLIPATFLLAILTFLAIYLASIVKDSVLKPIWKWIVK
jgi:hypothetical protein